MRYLFYILIFLILLLLSCTQTKAKEDDYPTQNIPEATNIQQPPVYTTPVDDYVVIGGYRTKDRLSRASRETEVSISIEKRECADLSGIEQFINLEQLRLSLPETSDIDFSPLKSLSKLGYIYIGGRALTEIPDLEGIPLLTRLQLSANSLTSLDGLEKLPQLEWLHISENLTPITDTSALQYLKKLRELRIYFGDYDIDFSHLNDLPELEYIYLCDCGDFDLAGIGQLSQLKKLNLEIRVSRETGERSIFRNIEEIGGMTGLEELYINEVIASVGFLANNASLERLELIAGWDRLGEYGEPLIPLDVAPLGNLKNLKYLTIRGFELINAHVLASLPELERIDTNLYPSR
jgi:Leucine-rich repeat (LRR) protein